MAQTLHKYYKFLSNTKHNIILNIILSCIHVFNVSTIKLVGIINIFYRTTEKYQSIQLNNKN